MKVRLSLQVDSEALIPLYATPGAAGADLRAALKEPMILAPGQTAMIPTGVRAEIPEGYELQVRPRSGLAAKHGVTVLNAPGTIDSDYRGEIAVLLINCGPQPFTVVPLMRIAQLVLAPVLIADFVVQTALSSTSRGDGGFGHTGVK